MLTFLRGFRGFEDPNKRGATGADPLEEIVAEGKVPDTAVHVSQASYHLRPSSHWTQVDQDHFDEETRHQARESLIQSWKDRLSAISLITTFFVATEAQLLSATASGNGKPSKLGMAANAGLTGALVIHSFAAIVSFVAAFFLINHTLREAKLELKLDFDEVNIERTESTTSTADGQRHRHVRERSVMKHDTRIIHYCRFNSSLPPVQLLERCNHLCMFLTAVGFTLEILGILCYAWNQMGIAVSAFASGLTLFCLVSSALVMKPTYR